MRSNSQKMYSSFAQPNDKPKKNFDTLSQGSSHGSQRSLKKSLLSKKLDSKNLKILTRFDKSQPDFGLPKARTAKYHDTKMILGDDFNIPKPEKVVYEKHMELVKLNMNEQKFDKELGGKLNKIVKDFDDKKETTGDKLTH